MVGLLNFLDEINSRMYERVHYTAIWNHFFLPKNMNVCTPTIPYLSSSDLSGASSCGDYCNYLMENTIIIELIDIKQSISWWCRLYKGVVCKFDAIK